MDIIFKRDNGMIGQSISFHDENGKPYDKPLVDQSAVEDCDINNIISRYQRAAVPLPPLDPSRVRYGDFTDVTNFQDAQIRILEAQEMFDALPAKLRARFENDPAMFLDFVDDPNNMDEMVKLGLVEKPKGVPQEEPSAPKEEVVESQNN